MNCLLFGANHQVGNLQYSHLLNYSISPRVKRLFEDHQLTKEPFVDHETLFVIHKPICCSPVIHKEQE